MYKLETLVELGYLLCLLIALATQVENFLLYVTATFFIIRFLIEKKKHQSHS